MNDQQFKMALRQLDGEGWFEVNLTDDLLENFIGPDCDQPSDEVKERFLAEFRARIQNASLRGAYRPIAKRKSARSSEGCNASSLNVVEMKISIREPSQR